MSNDAFPKWKYSTAAAVIVNDEAAEAALEGDWFDSPADVPAADAPVVPVDQFIEQVVADGRATKKKAT